MGGSRRLGTLAVTVLAALTTLVVGTAGGCNHGTDRPGPADGASLDFTSRATVTLRDTGIDPPSLQLRVGEAFTVVNGGTGDHGLASSSIDTGTLRPGESTIVFLTEAGTIDAYDRAAPDHHVRIEVSAAS